jgi:hypothetical protein
MKLKILIAAIAALFIAACDQDVTSAERSVTESAIGTVRAVDRDARRFDLRIDGRTLTLSANEAVRAFDILEVGDRVRVTYTEALAVSMAEPGEDGAVQAAAGDELVAGGGMIGRAAGGVVTAVVTFQGYDRASNKATVVGPEGNIFVVDVAPEMRAFARSRAVGDQIRVTYAVGAAVSLELAPEV